MARSNIGDAVRAARRSLDMTQEELAESARIVPTYVNAIECNRRGSVTLEKLHCVTRALGCRLELVPDSDFVVPVRLSRKTIELLDRLARRGLHGVGRDRVAESLIYSALRAEFAQGEKVA